MHQPHFARLGVHIIAATLVQACVWPSVGALAQGAGLEQKQARHHPSTLAGSDSRACTASTASWTARNAEWPALYTCGDPVSRGVKPVAASASAAVLSISNWPATSSAVSCCAVVTEAVAATSVATRVAGVLLSLVRARFGRLAATALGEAQAPAPEPAPAPAPPPAVGVD